MPEIVFGLVVFVIILVVVAIYQMNMLIDGLKVIGGFRDRIKCLESEVADNYAFMRKVQRLDKDIDALITNKIQLIEFEIKKLKENK